MSTALALLQRRRERLYQALDAAGLDAFYARNDSDIRWLCGFDDVFDGEQAHALMALPHELRLHTDSRYILACEEALASQQCQAQRVQGESLNLHTLQQDAARELALDAKPESHARALVRSLASLEGCSTIKLGIEDSMTLSEYHQITQLCADQTAGPVLDFCETSGLIKTLRAIKDDEEIARMRQAQAITDEAFQYICGFIRPGLTEREVKLELEDYMRRHGADELAFPSIVATGPHGASPHAIAGDTILEAGHCVVLDFGAKFAGYCSDMTRTVFLGAPDGKMARAWECVREANESVQAALRAGVSGAHMQQLAEDILADGGFGGYMGHGLGHGVGLDIHELPSLSLRYTEVLEEGAVVTVEPGIYIPGEFGMRLEDFGVVTTDGFEVFTKSTHDTVII